MRACARVCVSEEKRHQLRTFHKRMMRTMRRMRPPITEMTMIHTGTSSGSRMWMSGWALVVAWQECVFREKPIHIQFHTLVLSNCGKYCAATVTNQFNKCRSREIILDMPQIWISKEIERFHQPAEQFSPTPAHKCGWDDTDHTTKGRLSAETEQQD